MEQMWDLHSYTFIGVGCCQWCSTNFDMGVYARESRLGEASARTISTATQSSLELTCILLTQALNDLRSTDFHHYYHGCHGPRLGLSFRCDQELLQIDAPA